MSARDETDLARAIAQIALHGNLVDAQRIRAFAKQYGARATPFLLRASQEGSSPVVAAAIQALARIDPDTLAERALAVLAESGRDAEVRAAAVETLSLVHSEGALTALLQATLDSPLVAGAAIAALREHRSEHATARIREHLQSILDDLARSNASAATETDERLVARRRRASRELVVLVVERSDEADLRASWRTYPDAFGRLVAANSLLEKGDYAWVALNEGLPGANEGRAIEPGAELDNPEVRNLLASSAYIVLRDTSAADAFGRLSRFFEADCLGTWFGDKRAEILLCLLIGQAGANLTTWLSVSCEELHRRGIPPDPRWRDLASRLPGDSPLQALAARLRASLSPSTH